MERVPIEIESFHHVYNRGTEKRDIFLSDTIRRKVKPYFIGLNTFFSARIFFSAACFISL